MPRNTISYTDQAIQVYKQRDKALVVAEAVRRKLPYSHGLGSPFDGLCESLRRLKVTPNGVPNDTLSELWKRATELNSIIEHNDTRNPHRQTAEYLADMKPLCDLKRGLDCLLNAIEPASPNRKRGRNPHKTDKLDKVLERDIKRSNPDLEDHKWAAYLNDHSGELPKNTTADQIRMRYRRLKNGPKVDD